MDAALARALDSVLAAKADSLVHVIASTKPAVNWLAVLAPALIGAGLGLLMAIIGYAAKFGALRQKVDDLEKGLRTQQPDPTEYGKLCQKVDNLERHEDSAQHDLTNLLRTSQRVEDLVKEVEALHEEVRRHQDGREETNKQVWTLAGKMEQYEKGLTPKGNPITQAELDEFRRLRHRLVHGAAFPHALAQRFIALGRKVEEDLPAVERTEFGALLKQLTESLGRESLVSSAAAPPGLDLDFYKARVAEVCRFLRLEALAPVERDRLYRIALNQVFVEPEVRPDIPGTEIDKELVLKIRERRSFAAEDEFPALPKAQLDAARRQFLELPTHRLWEVVTDPKDARMVIVGDPGSGKSTLARFLAFSLVVKTEGGEQLRMAMAGCVPFLIELRDYAAFRRSARPDCRTFVDFIAWLYGHEGHPLEKSALLQFLRGGGAALFIFDGLDEVFDATERESATREIAALSYPNIRVLVTSRIVGYQKAMLENAGFSHYTLQDLNETRIDEFSRKWFAVAMPEDPQEGSFRRERIMSAVRESASIRALAGNPLLLTVMAIMARNTELPRERHRIYDHAARVLVEDWDVNKHLKSQNLVAPNIEVDDKKDMLRHAAQWMQEQRDAGSGNYISRADLERLFAEYLAERFRFPEITAGSVARAMIAQFRERNFILCYYGADLYGFVHRAFLEYFCASAYVERMTKRGDYRLEGFLEDVLAKHWQDVAWHEIIRLVCGMAGDWYGMRIAERIVKLGSMPIDKQLREQAALLSALCMAECRDPGAEAGIADAVLRFGVQTYEGTDYKVEWIGAETVVSVSTAYPSLDRALESAARICAIPNLPLLWNGDEASPLRSKNSAVRSQALELLASIPSSADTFTPVARQFARNDSDPVVRSWSLWILSRRTDPDSETAGAVEYAVSHDGDPHVRATAMYALTRFSPAGRTSEEVLRNAAMTDPDPIVRSSALFRLADLSARKREILDLVKDRALNGDHAMIRGRALRVLAEHWGADDEVRALLRERLRVDKPARPFAREHRFSDGHEAGAAHALLDPLTEETPPSAITRATPVWQEHAVVDRVQARQDVREAEGKRMQDE